MEIKYSLEICQEIAEFLLESTAIRPLVGIICGSGLSSLANTITDCHIIEYDDIPCFPSSSVEGHINRMIFGWIDKVQVVALQGRFHYYEGHSIDTCVMPVRVLKLLGIKYLVVTNAAGAINTGYKIGDIMLLNDHINIMGMSGGASALRGPNFSCFGPRFPATANAYDRRLLESAKNCVKSMHLKQNIHEGVYCAVCGPNYETSAEIKMLRSWGVDAVGMSTVPEVITAVHCGLKVFAFSIITNMCASSDSDSQDNNGEINHEEVVMVGKSLESVCNELVCSVVGEIKTIAEEM